MPDEQGDQTDDGARPTRSQMVERYSGLARVAAAGSEPVDTPTGTPTDGCGATAYGVSAAELGVPAGALRASMACGNPVEVADLQPGDTVLDPGSGGGLDVLLSARRVGPEGHVYGIDASPDMIELARAHADEAGVGNAEFRLGYLEDIPLSDAAVDVVISNCVFTLSTDKPRALAEAARVLRPGGRFGISDVLAEPGLDPARRAEAEHTVGCPVGTLTADEYRDQLLAAGFATTAIIPTHPLAGGLYSAIVQGDPVRLRLLSLIASHEGGEACVCDISDVFDLTGPTISHHLKVLREAGLITGDRRGTWIYYRVQPNALRVASTVLTPVTEAATAAV